MEATETRKSGRMGILRNSLEPQFLLRIALGGIFIYAGIVKLITIREFAGVISVYGIVPDSLLALTAIGLPILEIATGAGLMLNIRFCLECVTGLLVLFIFVLWFGMLEGLDVDCGCFSVAEQNEHDGLKNALVRDVLFLATAGYLFYKRWKNRPGT